MASLAAEFSVFNTTPATNPLSTTVQLADEELASVALIDLWTEIEHVLQHGLVANTYFAFSKTYPPESLPNPGLSVEGLGRFDLPLSESYALALISASVPQPSASTGGVVAPGVWKIASDKIHIENPAWENWIRDEAGPAAVCGLRAEGADGELDYVLRELTIHESSDAKISSAKMGELVVLLPSSFTGGILELFHDGYTETMDLATESGRITSIVAAYVGVNQILSGVTSGYRLGLTYDIVHRSGRLPTLADLDSSKQRIRKLLRAWQRDESGYAPQFIACLLKTIYSHSAAFDASCLRGADDLLVSVLQPLAEEQEVSLHLAHIEVTAKTTADCGDYDSSIAWNEVESMADESFISSFREDQEEVLKITHLMDLEGIPVEVEGLRMDISDLINGSDATVYEPDSTTFDTCEVRELILPLRETYKRTVLFLWPESSSSLTVTLGDVREPAWNVLSTSNSATPTCKEKNHVESVIQWSRTAQQDLELFRVLYLIRKSTERAMEACNVHQKIELIGYEGFVSACRRFGWNALRDFCTLAVTNERSKIYRWELIMCLSDLALADHLMDIQVWCQWQQCAMLRSLHQLDPQDVEWLVDVSIIGGADLWPQVEVQWLPVAQFWAPFLRQLHCNRTRIAPSDPDTVCSLVHHALEGIVAELDAFPINTVNGAQQANWQIILSVINLCLDTDQLALCTIIGQNMRNKAKSGGYSPQFLPWTYYLEITRGLEHSFSVRPERLAYVNGLGLFFEDLLVFALSPMRSEGGRLVFPCTLTPPILTNLMTAAKRVGGATFLRGLFEIQPEILHRDRDSLRELARSIIADSRPSDTSAVYPDYRSITSLIVDAAGDTFQVEYDGHSEVLDLIDFCLEVEAPPTTYERFLMRVLSPPEGTTLVQHLSKVLVPLLSNLLDTVAHRKTDFKNSAFERFAATVIRQFAENCMPMKPSRPVPVQQLHAIGCQEGCKDCMLVKDFALDGQDVIQIRRPQDERSHLERQLKRYGFDAFGFTWETIKGGRPYILQIKKPDNIVVFGMWRASHLTGMEMLTILGSTDEQRRVLGEDYDRVLAAIEGVDGRRRRPLANLSGINQERIGQKRVGGKLINQDCTVKKPRLVQ
ncbi:hypothetical protein B0H19DRAFT_1163045 [Mycena capillaripes]|nr:hypothetical protein B0H19DRAFT_1163045 [Mycena capillaripes]